MKIGAYQILGELGRGGFGTVFRARAADGRLVALKVLRPRPGAERALERELRLAASLGELEGFVPILDLGAEATGDWFAMPLLEGGTVRERLARVSLDS